MKFGHPEMIWALVAFLPVLGAFFWWSRRERHRLISRFVQSRLLASLTVGVSERRQLFKSWLLVLAVGLLLIALARPHWNYDWQEASQQGLDIVVAVDTSRSMLATDLPPDRLTRTQLAIRDLMLKARTDRLGLVPFAGTAFVQCPLTVDQEAFQQNVNILDVDIIPEPGSDLGAAIDAAATAFEEGGGTFRVIVLFSDGEDHNNRALKAAQEAAKKDIRIFTIGIGTADGELLQVKDARGNSSYLRDGEGNVIKSRLNESLLREVAEAADGFYLPLSGPDTINVLYERGLAPLPRSELAAAKVKRPIDRFQWPLGCAILLLVIETFVSERRRVSRADRRAVAPKPYWQAALLLLLTTGMATASPRSARRFYDRGEFNTALEEYRRLLNKDEENARLSYNAGTAAFQAGQYEAAAEHFSAAQGDVRDLDLQQQAYYNRGNALYRQGETTLRDDLDGTIERWQQAVADYESALKLRKDDPWAAHNKAFVEKKLMALKKQQQQQQNQKSKQNGNQPQQQGKGGEGQPQPGQGNQPKDQGQPQDPSEQDQPGGNGQDESQPGRGQQPPEQSPQGPGGEERHPQDPNEQLGAYGQMTPEQARQLLEAQRGEERALLFLPQNRTNRIRDPRKTW